MVAVVSGLLNRVKSAFKSKNYKRMVFETHSLSFKILNDMAWAFKDGSYYEVNVEYWLDKILKEIKNPILYDVGANYGYYSLILSKNAEKIYSFEPVKATFKVLKWNVAKNNISNVQIFNTALSDIKGSSYINIYSSSGNNSMYSRKIPIDHPTKFVKKTKIRTDTIDDLIKSGVVKVPNLIKIDVEGAELSVLKGALITLSTHHPILLIEYSQTTCNDAGYSCDDIYKLINSFDYKVYGLSEDCNDLKLYAFDPDLNQTFSNIIAFPKQYNLHQ